MDDNANKKDNNLIKPLFIVGMPRSGTKLLRGLLLEHDSIGIPLMETEFLPYWVKNWEKFGDLSQYPNFEKFYTSMIGVPYFYYTKRANALIEPKVWFELCKTYDPAGVFEALIRHDAKVDYGSNKIWGDKSPGYIWHLQLIKRLFPDAKIIHIVRDVRDYCLSLNKGWGKNMIRAAQRWTDGVSKVKTDASQYKNDFIEVRYEDLLKEPQTSLEQLCDFIGIEFQSQMLKLSSPPENKGDAIGQTQILTKNTEKYIDAMSPSTRARIEAIAGTTLESCGYKTNVTEPPKRVPAVLMILYQILDAIYLIKSNYKEAGFIGSIKFHLRQYLLTRIK